MTSLKSLAIALLTAACLPAQNTWDNRAFQLSSSSGTTPTHSSYAGGRFILATVGSTFWHSAAGTAAWTSAILPNPPGAFASSGIATDGSTLIIAGSSNTIYTTTSASVAGLPATPISWTKLNPAVRASGTPALGRVRHLNGQFIVTTAPFIATVDPNNNSYAELLTSPDGQTWTSKKFLANTTGNFAYTTRDIAFKPGATAGTGTYVITTNISNTILTAPEDLSSLTPVTVNGLVTSGQSVIYANGNFVAVTRNGSILTSPNGTSWIFRSKPISTTRINDVFHDGTDFVVVGNVVAGSSPARPFIVKSTDAITWTEPTTVPAANGELFTVTKADGLWLTAGSSGTLFTSGSASVTPPTVDPLPLSATGTAGETFTLSASVGGTPAATSFEWFRNSVPITNGSNSSGSVISGADTASLTISGLSLSDGGTYFVRVTNNVGVVNSTVTTLKVSATAGGAILTPYGSANSLGGSIIPGSSPPRTLLGSAPATFTASGGITGLPNTFVSLTSYGNVGGVNPSGTKVLLGSFSGNFPLLVYDLAAESGTQLPAVPLPLGPISNINLILPIGLADNGDATGIIQDFNGQNRAFHYSAAMQTYTLLGNVPNAGNDIASNPGGISADGSTIAGYERTGLFNGAFLWTTTGGFTLLPDPKNGGLANADIRAISPNARYIVGYGSTSPAFGSGQSAMRWDRGAGLAAPVGSALVRTRTQTFGDAFCVNDDGTAGGNVRQGSSSFSNNRAAVWLPDGALIVLPDYLASRYSLTTPGFTLNQVTSISADRRVIAGTAADSTSQVQGWLLTLPDPLEITSPTPELLFRMSAITNSGSSYNFGSTQIGSGITPSITAYLSNIGSAGLLVSSVSLSGTNAADFSLIPTPPASNLPGTYVTGEVRAFTVRYDPQPGPAGPRSAILTVASDDPATPSFVVNLNATATAPPAASPAELALENYLIAASVPANLRGPLDDPDADGISNLLEFALGLPPLTSSALPNALLATGELSLTYTRAQPAHVIYTVKTSTDLGATESWTPGGVDQGIPDVNGLTTANVPANSAKRFLRIEVNLVP